MGLDLIGRVVLGWVVTSRFIDRLMFMFTTMFMRWYDVAA